MTDIAEIMARAMGETLIPGSTTLSARYVISPELIDRMALAALTALQERGFAVVPVYPTDAMIDAGKDESAHDPRMDRGVLTGLWSAMLAASPGSSGVKE